MQEKFNEVRARAANVANDPACKEKAAGREILLDAITKLQEGGNTDEIAAVKAKIAKSAEALAGGARLAMVDHDTRKSFHARITELEAQEKLLAAEFEKLEGELYLTEQFVRAKVGLLEDKINSRFEHARFKLFNVLVNGGIEEVCETLYRGVPYGSALNNAAQINVGLDIINTLSEHYGFSAPIWIDNAEAVVDLLPTKGQMIRLVVSGGQTARSGSRPGGRKKTKEVV